MRRRQKAVQLVAVLSLALLVGIARSATIPAPSANEVPESGHGSENDEADELLVMFNSYASQIEHNRRVSAFLASHGLQSLARVVRRPHVTSDIPTDFVVVACMKGSSDAVAKALIRLPDLRRVSKQRQVNRAALQADDGHDDATSVRGHAKRLMERKEAKDDSMQSAAHLLKAHNLWGKGITGRGVKVGIFDTGLRNDHPHFKHVKERTNWTDEDMLDDAIGHGSFVAGVVASTKECLGLAPDAELYIFRVFTLKQTSYTSWFLDAFNYAIFRNLDVINLSIGGPDFMDLPFVDKVNEITANNIIMVSAIGNDGPLYGTLNNPADQNNVIGVGGITFDHAMASFSSRGMTTWELPDGYGRFKPDVVTYSAGVVGSKSTGGCRALSGTSVASPVVAGAVALLASVVPEEDRARIINPASMKQALLETALPVQKANIFEQGAGRINLAAAAVLLENYQPRASLYPSVIDTSDCPYMWPFCASPLFYGAQPWAFNVTVLNGMDVYGWIEEAPIWSPLEGERGDILDVSFEYSRALWPWAGYLVVRVSVNKDGAWFKGTASGFVTLTVTSPPQGEATTPQKSVVHLPVTVTVTAPPPRSRRLLWDQTHSLAYPPGYFPRDNLNEKSDPLDWNGDHPHTNFRSVYNFLVSHGFFIDTLGSPFNCFDPREYAALLIVDPENEFFDSEVKHLEKAVREDGLSVIVLADWYNTDVMELIKFYDENTRNWWFPETGGSNIPALNKLLAPFNIELSTAVFDGKFTFKSEVIEYQSGTTISKFPAGGTILTAHLKNQASELLSQRSETDRVPVLGLHQPSGHNAGRIVVYGDSNCMDDSHASSRPRCTSLLLEMVNYALKNDDQAETLLQSGQRLETDLDTNLPAAERSPKSTLHLYSQAALLQGELDYSPFSCPKYSWARARPAQRMPAQVNEMFQHREASNQLEQDDKPFVLPELLSDDESAQATASSSSGSGWMTMGFIVTLVVVAVLFVARRQRPEKRPDKP